MQSDVSHRCRARLYLEVSRGIRRRRRTDADETPINRGIASPHLSAANLWWVARVRLLKAPGLQNFEQAPFNDGKVVFKATQQRLAVALRECVDHVIAHS